MWKEVVLLIWNLILPWVSDVIASANLLWRRPIMVAWKCMVLCVRLGMAASIDGVRVKKVARRRTQDRIGTALKDLEKLLEEATDLFRKKIRWLSGRTISEGKEEDLAQIRSREDRISRGEERWVRSCRRSYARLKNFRCVWSMQKGFFCRRIEVKKLER